MKLRLPIPRHFKPGKSPGEVVEEEVADRPQPFITVFSYGPDGLEERAGVSVDEALGMIRADHITWINVDGMGDLETLRRLWDRFRIHPLVQEDVVNLHQRPKFEEYEGHDYLVLHMVRLQEETIASEQVSICFGTDWLVSFQESQGDVFDPVRERIRKARPRLVNGGPDYLAYALLDALVDGFFPVVSSLGGRLEDLEAEILSEPEQRGIESVYALRRELLSARRALFPLREAITSMQRTTEASPLIRKETRPFLRDAYDHVVRITELVEAYRELAGQLTDLYYTSLSHRLNEVMKVLTIVATIFIPITFVAGVYGMNFANMPELDWRYGYFLALGLMATVALGMLVMFRRRGWI